MKGPASILWFLVRLCMAVFGLIRPLRDRVTGTTDEQSQLVDADESAW